MTDSLTLFAATFAIAAAWSSPAFSRGIPLQPANGHGTSHAACVTIADMSEESIETIDDLMTRLNQKTPFAVLAISGSRDVPGVGGRHGAHARGQFEALPVACQQSS